jgi:transposase-like protein
MFEGSQHFDLTHRRLFHYLVLIRILLEFLYSNYSKPKALDRENRHSHHSARLLTEFSSLLILRFVHDTIGSLADDTHNFVLVHVYESAVLL